MNENRKQKVLRTLPHEVVFPGSDPANNEVKAVQQPLPGPKVFPAPRK